MTTPQKFIRRSPLQRAAFTLVEMLMVIAIIGILVGLLTPAVIRALNQANEFEIINEIQQLDAEMEQFNIDYGFYPPAIGPGMEIDTNNRAQAVSKLRRYLNRMAPNNSEGNGAATTPLGVWYDNVGVNLDSRSSLVFWLSGICKNRQFPLSGGMGGNLPAYNDGTVEREVRYEFLGDQLELLGAVAIYKQPSGKDNGDSAYRYRDAKSYADVDGAGNVVARAYHEGFDTSSPPQPINFQNPGKFQIVAPGLDGDVSSVDVPTLNIQMVDAGQLDNICNFVNGRLEKLVE